MTDKPASRPLLSRTLTSLAAIVAVSAIFGAKAVELERRHQGDDPAPVIAQAAGPTAP